ncbi:MAG TPA: efflux transporter periplasmic adaptor subunit, partial [Bryobacteraceae bacterium]|nr:efflux transporter periplasmic adaptor subunit [Bryobacteraceae bacterium]
PKNLLRPGQFVRVRVTSGQRPDAVLVPQTAIQEILGATSVMIVGPGNKVAQRTVTTGDTYQNLIIVTQGLNGGESVIVQGQQKVRPGITVKPQAAAAGQESGQTNAGQAMSDQAK